MKLAQIIPTSLKILRQNFYDQNFYGQNYLGVGGGTKFLWDQTSLGPIESKAEMGLGTISALARRAVYNFVCSTPLQDEHFCYLVCPTHGISLRTSKSVKRF